jgi:SAM-dependent methyltransferase
MKHEKDDTYAYIGSELDLFALAVNWKSYWSQAIKPFLGLRVLDVGAGKGSTARLLSGAPGQRWLALEPDPQLANSIREDIAGGRLPTACEVRIGTLAALAVDELFDTILYIDVLEHIETDRDELTLAATHLAPNGHIVVLSPAHNSLYTPFDKALGHFRRYDSELIRAVTPPSLALEKVFYLDSVGLLASLGNRLVLNAALPTAKQIGMWDRWMVPLSRYVDPLTGHKVGKSIVGVWRHAGSTGGNRP